jgi:ABC-type uncharacterized transport system permease subunit
MRPGHAFVAGYVVLLAAFGVVPTVYGIYFAFTNSANYFSGLSNFTAVARDFRYLPAVGHAGLYLLIWLVSLVVFVTSLALVLHQLPARRISRVVRFVYYISGALAGVASVMVWLFMLDPTVSPVAGLLRLLGYDVFGQVVQEGHLAVLFAMIAFWTGAGGWIVVMYGALNNIPLEVTEAAHIDGAGGWQVARRIQIPILRKRFGFEAEVIDPPGWALKGVPVRAELYTPAMADYYDLVVGLHPDQALRSVVESADKAAVLVVPCCNFWTRDRRLGRDELIEQISAFHQLIGGASERVTLAFSGPANHGLVLTPGSKAAENR